MATKAQQERIAGWVSRWKTRLLLDHWAIIVEYETAAYEYKRSDGRHSEGMAEITVDQRYREARLKVYPSLLTMPVGYQRATILHEIAHIVTWDVKKAAERAHQKGAFTAKERDDLYESITEDIAKIVLKERNPRKDNYRL